MNRIAVRPFHTEKILPPRNGAPFEWPVGKALDIEVGCGVGLHPIRRALERPERVLVAIEHTRSRFERFARRVSNHRKPEKLGNQGLSNLVPVHADAVAWITHFVPARSVERYFFLYPNPYPKRWHSMPFFGRVLETLKEGERSSLPRMSVFISRRRATTSSGPGGLKSSWRGSFQRFEGFRPECLARISSASTSPEVRPVLILSCVNNFLCAKGMNNLSNIVQIWQIQ